jgi:hypothetical protein
MTYTASLRYGTLGFVSLTVGDVRISPGTGTHRLAFPIKVTGSWLNPDEPDSNAPTLLTGSVWTDQPNLRWLAPVPVQVLTVRGYEVGGELSIDLGDDQLIALERARGQADLSLVLNLQATLLSSDPGVYPVADEQVQFRIPAGRWLELLDQAGSEVGIVLRVPSPLTDSALDGPPAASAADVASLSQATARLRQARTELRDQQWEHCVATCRRVLENVARLSSLPSYGEVSKVAATDRTKNQRWAAIYYDVKSMTSAAHHDDGTTAGFTWTRVDAEALLAATGALLVRYTSA